MFHSENITGGPSKLLWSRYNWKSNEKAQRSSSEVAEMTTSTTTRQRWLQMMVSSLLLFFCFPTLSYGVAAPRTLLDRLSESGRYLTTEELWFNQTLDHFSPYVITLFFSPFVSYNMRILTILVGTLVFLAKQKMRLGVRQ